jgi:hypothetical protein
MRTKKPIQKWEQEQKTWLALSKVIVEHEQRLDKLEGLEPKEVSYKVSTGYAGANVYTLEPKEVSDTGCKPLISNPDITVEEIKEIMNPTKDIGCYCVCHLRDEIELADYSKCDHCAPTKTSNVNALLDVDNLASRFHKVYQKELERQGKKSKYDDFFFKLPEDIKDLDRALAKYVIEFVLPNCIDDLLSSAREEYKRELIEKLKEEMDVADSGDIQGMKTAIYILELLSKE